MSIKFKFLKAGHGDAIFISTDTTNILIDGGTRDTYIDSISDIYEELKESNQNLDLVILTHMDNDHIEGLIELLEEEVAEILEDDDYIPTIKEVWFNSLDYKIFNKISPNSYIGAREQVTFREFIHNIKDKIAYKEYISVDSETMLEKNEIKFILLSPNDNKLKKAYKKNEEILRDYISSTKESFSKDCDESIEDLALNPLGGDSSVSNGSSIAFILIYDNKKYLFLGDAHIPLVVENLKKHQKYFNKEGKIEFEFVKLSHHGSRYNLNQAFLNLIATDNFIILTDGSHSRHPHKETLSKIILNMQRKKSDSTINFIFNYKHMIYHNRLQEEQEKRGFRLLYSSCFPLS